MVDKASLSRLKSFWSEFKSSKTGMFGLVLLLLLVVIAIFFPYIGNKQDIENWSNFQYWQGYPKHAPPCWATRGTFRTLKINNALHDSHIHFQKGLMNGLTYISYSILFNVKEKPPVDLIVKFDLNYNNYTYVYLRVDRPDGEYVELTNNPFNSSVGTSLTTLFGINPRVFHGIVIKNIASYVLVPITVQEYLLPWLEKNNIKTGPGTVAALSRTGFDVLFRVLSPKIVNEREYLKGTYNFTVTFASKDPKINGTLVNAIVVGGCYGLSGTDAFGRDLMQGILYGIRWALIIGLLASIVSVIFGGVYGVTGGYFGGYVDELMLRGAQIVYSIPILPLIILLAAIFRPSIWNLIVLLIVFGWPGIGLVTRSMSLQLKEEKYVEAARALGAGHIRIMFMYILPQILPYLFASIALSVPGAVLTEAGVSFLGLGDPLVLTWGKILNQAQGAAATINGYWWWVIPPGLMITIVGMTFILIGQALDTILNPRLKR